MWVLVLFVVVIKIPWQKPFKGRRGYVGSQFQGICSFMAVESEEMVAGIGGQGNTSYPHSGSKKMIE